MAVEEDQAKRGCKGEGGVSSVAPSNWLKAVQVLALLLTTVTKRLVGTGLGGRGGGDRSGAVHNVLFVQYIFLAIERVGT